ncbi:beta-crystallin A1-like [Tigriopus californicus]|uniref:beta-crystallin A1-like n=1 Tax=Tigriopus californicus TaxID=6832 RepID=UPI0027DA7979|nr:beta-crystallin A1-like [Tigriopus californicus]
MKVFLFLSTLAVTALASSRPPFFPQVTRSNQQENQELQCYEFPSYEGIAYRFNDYAPSLSPFDFDNVISSCCFNGVWILYDEHDYNKNDFGAAVYSGWGEGACFTFDATFDDKASSLRFAGAPDGYKQDTINFYESKYFIGEEQYFYDDAPQFNFDNFGQSVIVTGCAPWTIYEYDNYQGESICLYPSDTTECYPSFYAEPTDLGFLASQVSSARKGCFSKNEKKGKATFP